MDFLIDTFNGKLPLPFAIGIFLFIAKLCLEMCGCAVGN